MDACLQAFQMMHSMKVSSVKMQNTPTLTIANLCVFYCTVPFVYPLPSTIQSPQMRPPRMRGCSKAEPGGRKEAGHEFWVLSSEFWVLSFRPSAFDLESLRVAPFPLVSQLLSADFEAGSN